MKNLSGKRALVTGGSRGIGAAIAKALAENGADVAITYERSVDHAAGVVKSITDQGRRGIAIQADSADPESILRAVAETVEGLGGLDILINNAAIGRPGTVAEISLEDIQAMLDINVRAPVLFAQAAIPHLPAGGRIISIGSALAERVPFPGVTAYAMTKSALLSFTRGLSRELGPKGVTVNLVLPGSVDTEMNPANGENADFQRSLTSLGRYAKPSEIGDIVAFLASPAADLITGTSLTADGGFSA
ncbi:SDR family NAD(P)-dependent oxidoreductase [Pseudomonas sp. ICMP 561]|uniref:SDR family NAD(P)-dependent oxidoreductase n=1 Tax=Pseudomonas sp. ICMP 561 TaxID=1718918 RepID=UPI000C07DB58|nr:3-oxoacyl-ACP reductase family protein [Pseudomonas sp. ICMP 561]PHN17163.1 oxidoreductase [Pseudomonas sp. ICMP 561]